MFALILKNELRHFKDHCCAGMTEQVNKRSQLGAGPMEGSTDQRIYWSPIFDEYGLICQPSPEILKIQFCPFCGSRLPLSKRYAWFEYLKKAGWKTWDDRIPDEMLAYDWEEYLVP